MRTTLTLEPDVESALGEIERRTGTSRKSLINDLLRRGLRAREQEAPKARIRYVTEPFDPGPPRVTSVHSVYDLLALAEGESFR
jgi:hypothetical protein